MKSPYLPLASLILALSISGFLAPSHLRAQEAEAKPKPAAETAEPETAEELEQAEQEAETKEAADVKEKLAVFKTLEGEWIGEESIDYNPDFRKPNAPNKTSWKDEWKGFYTNDSRYFEMTGKTSGKISSTYHWYVTYDTSNEEYRAWSFGSSGWGEYKGHLTDDGKAVLWEKGREMENADMAETFELRAKGDQCTANGETKVVSKDGSVSQNYAKQHSKYIRKKISI